MMRVDPAVRLALLLLICAGLTSGCGVGPQPLLSPQAIATRVGTHYGDPHSVVVRARTDWTEVDGTPMYLMTVAGQMRKDGVEAATVTFSALATRFSVWDVRGFDGAGQLVWTDPEWGACPGSRG